MKRNMTEQKKSEYYVRKIIKEHMCAENDETGINPVLVFVIWLCRLFNVMYHS